MSANEQNLEPCLVSKIKVLVIHENPRCFEPQIGRLPYVPMHQNTCEHVHLIDSNTKFDLSSRIINRFQWFFVFWKAEDLLFHLKATVCTNCKFFSEKNNFSYKNVQLIWKFASLVIWDLLGGRAKWPPKPYNCVRYVPSRDEDR